MLKRPFATVFMPPQLDIRWNQSDCACVVLDCECCAKQHCMRRSRFGHPTRDLSAARSLILISDVSVRCTGHFAAISINFACCSAVKDPVNSISTSILSNMPSFVAHSSQSSADSQCAQQIIVRIRACIAAACAHRFISDKIMSAHGNLLFETARITAHDDIGCSTIGLGAHVLITRAEYLRTRRDIAR